MDETRSRLRRARERLGLSQTALAEAAGVSRQLVAAVERGRNAPSVDAAIRLARVLGESVEGLFGAEPAVGWLPGEPPAEGEPVRVVPVGDSLVAAPAGTPPPGPSWEASDGVVEGGRVRLLPGAERGGALVLGCDPALGILEALAAARGPRRVVGVHATSGAAVEALRAGRAHAALVHARAGALPAPGVPVARVQVARWRVGFAVPAAGPAPAVPDILARAPAIVQRQESAASQRALAEAAAGLGLPVPPGPRAGGHLEAARVGRDTGAPALTMEPAARAFGLGFVPIETHSVELWIGDRWRGEPAVAGLLDVLRSAALRARLEAVGGYDLEGIGDPVVAA